MILMGIDTNFDRFYFLDSWGHLYISLIILESLNNYDVYSNCSIIFLAENALYFDSQLYINLLFFWRG